MTCPKRVDRMVNRADPDQSPHSVAQYMASSLRSCVTVLTFSTRTGAQRITNTPVRYHFLIIKYVIDKPWLLSRFWVYCKLNHSLVTVHCLTPNEAEINHGVTFKTENDSMVQLWYNFRLLKINFSFIYIETMEHPLVNLKLMTMVKGKL